MSSDTFQFKHFTVRHDRCAQKVGVDSIVLGALADADNPRTAIDIGAGCGLLSLMLAQRFPDLRITAIEIDPEAAQQCAENFVANSRLATLNSLCCDIADFCPHEKADLIISNPPYFPANSPAPDSARSLARQGDTFSALNLPEIAAPMLSNTGLLWAIIPADILAAYLKNAEKAGLSPARIISIIHRPAKAPKRIVIALAKNGQKPLLPETSITLYDTENRPTSEFRKLCKDFYLDF